MIRYTLFSSISFGSILFYILQLLLIPGLGFDYLIHFLQIR